MPFVPSTGWDRMTRRCGVFTKRLGYRSCTTEPMMIQRLGKIPRFARPRVSRSNGVRKPQPLADRLAKAARARGRFFRNISAADTPLRQYVARIGGEIAGWCAASA